ncbi:LpqB family beta-propeller domain-containing protein [Spirillospora sp. CA-294931]|uniref:LpqB family beta-propeller domain-containing protein n=1 Tax=Spirillospora sp. CA-294931 TaxID=3240042 RepID=UPI003D9129A2
MNGSRNGIPTVAAVALVLLASGCATVPTGGRVVSGNPPERVEQVDNPYVRLIPVRPQNGWGPEQIVSGFMAASASFDDDHKVAKEYLSAPTVWQPGPRPAVTVLKDRGNPRVRANASEATVEMTGTQYGRIGADGQYTAEPDNVTVTFNLTKPRPNSQWRISGMPADMRGRLLLTKADVDRTFRPLNLYFFAPGQRTLVPNGVFLPMANRQELPTRLVQALLAGPTSWLGQAVKSAFPAGTRLLGGKVDVVKDVAVINLSAEGGGGNVARMSGQLAWTLRQLPEIKEWRLAIDGETVAPQQSVHNLDTFSPEGPSQSQGGRNPYIVGAAGNLSELVNDQPHPVLSTGPRMHRPAVAPNYTEIAGLSQQADKLLGGARVGNSLPVKTFLGVGRDGARFTAPSWGMDGSLWTVESAKNKSWLWVRQHRGKPMGQVKHWGLGGREVMAFRVARDGVRVAAIVKVDNRPQIQIGRIATTPEGGLDVGSFLPVSSELVETIDLAWRDYDTLAVLGRRVSDTQVLPYLVPVNGSAISPLGVGALGEPRTIAAAPDSPVLIGTRTQQDQICRQAPARDTASEAFGEWVCPIAGSDPTYPS